MGAKEWRAKEYESVLPPASDSLDQADQTVGAIFHDVVEPAKIADDGAKEEDDDRPTGYRIKIFVHAFSLHTNIFVVGEQVAPRGVIFASAVMCNAVLSGRHATWGRIRPE